MIIKLAVLEHEFASVTVTVYVPGDENEFAAVLVDDPPLHVYDVPPVAVTLIVVTAQVNSVVGGILLLVMPAVTEFTAILTATDVLPHAPVAVIV